MTQRAIPAVFMRGGSSKGVFFHARDLPAERSILDPIFLSVIGSPDPYGRQIDGMGGGVSSLSKGVIIGPPTRPDCDVDYTFAQVAVDRPVVDWTSNCGNLSSAVGPFAVDEGLIRISDGEALVRIHQVNTDKVIHARFQVTNGKTAVAGDFAIAGVAGTGARIRLDFLDPGGAATGKLLPTGQVLDLLKVPGVGSVAVTMIDAANPVVMLAALDLGLTGTELPDAIEARGDIMAALDAIRRHAAVAMGMAARPEDAGLAIPKVAMLSAPADYTTLDGQIVRADQQDVAIRMISMERAHRAVPLTGAMCLGVAARIEDTVAHRLSRPVTGDEVRVANPSGVLSVGAEVKGGDARSAVVFRTARRLMQGQVLLPE